MNKTLFTLLILVSFIGAKAQGTDTTQPGFPGGPTAFFSFLQQNVIYPPKAVKKNIEGKVYLSFVVEKDGSLTHIEVLRGVSTAIDAEAIRVIRHSPKWIPALQDGLPVRKSFDLAINFKLPSSTVNTQQMDTVTASPIDSNKKFIPMAKEPSFPGGEDAYFRFLQHNLKYPENAAKQRIEGKVFLSFVVEKDGTLTDITLVRGVNPDLDAEALRVIATSPKWKPGMQNSMPVRVKYNLAIVFKLQPQTINISEQRQMDSLRNLPSDQKIFTAVEHEPGFKGGNIAFLKYLQGNIHYPAQSREKHIQGKVFISFIVEKDGSLSDLKVVRGVSDDLDAEALRVLQESPKWDPGIQNGRAVRVAYTIPVSFTLSN